MIISCLKLEDVRIQRWGISVKRTEGPLDSSYFYPVVAGYVKNFGNTTAYSVMVHLTLVCSYPSPRTAEIEQYEELVDSVDLDPQCSSDFSIAGERHKYHEKPKFYTVSSLTVTWK